MRVDLQNFLKHASETMDALIEELNDRMDGDEFEKFCQQHQPGMYSGELLDVVDKIESVTDKTHTLEEFAKFYCIIPSET